MARLRARGVCLLLGALIAVAHGYAPFSSPHLARHAVQRSRPTLAVAVPPVRKTEEDNDAAEASVLEVVGGNNAPEAAHGAAEASADARAPALRPLRAVWQFSRPHTIIGSALCIPALTAFAAPTAASLLSAPLWLGALYALVPALLMNLYIVGLNQLFDVEIDKVNKPTLPLASGELSMRSGTKIVGASLVAALLIGFTHPVYSTFALRATLVGSALLGTAYSLPPLRLKRFPALAATCIMGVRGGLVNWGFFTHARTLLLASPSAMASSAGSWAVLRGLAPVAFFTLFGTVIALVKDVPDVEGDGARHREPPIMRG